MSITQRNATENIERVERAVRVAKNALFGENIPAVLWSPRDLWGLEVFGGYVIETDEDIWDAWTHMRMSSLTDLMIEDWERLIDVVEDALDEARGELMPKQTTREKMCNTAAVLVDEDTHPEYVRGIVELIAYWTQDDHLDGDIDGTIKDVLNRIERRPWK